MLISAQNILLISSILLFISLLASKTSFKYGVPVLIFFLAIGMLAGSEGIGGIYFDNPNIAQFVGIIALNFILFSGGFETNIQSIKPVLWHGISLSTLGVLITALSVGLFVWLVTDFSIYEGFLLGSIISSTDSAAVFSILRSKKLALKKNLRPMLELESGSNDPMAYALTLAFTVLVVNQDATLLSAIPMLLKQIVIGAIAGYLLGRVSKWIINKIRLDFEGLYVVLVIAIMFFNFSATDAIGGNGFLAVYISAVYLGNQELIHKKKILKSFDGFAWLMQIVLFLTLGLLVFPSHVFPWFGLGLLISLFLMLVARPLGVFLSLSFFKIDQRSRWFVSWVGLRGAVPIVLATYPLIAGVDKANVIFNIVFFISISSVLIQGTTLSVVARWLKLTLPEQQKVPNITDIQMFDRLKSELIEIVIPHNCSAVGKEIVELGFPPTALISIIQRDGKFITPSGSTMINLNDKLFVVAEDKESIREIFDCLSMSTPKQFISI
jgi:potassium/hydrogen antiporter